MNTAVPKICLASSAVPMLLGEVDDMCGLLGSYALAEDEMFAILVEGDWSFAGKGLVEMEELFGQLAEQEPDKMICAIVITGNLAAPDAVLLDRDSDWAPSLIVGGQLTARSMCLGGGQTKVAGDLTVQSTLYGHYNHGSLEVGGTTRAALILGSDFNMTFNGEVDCAHVVSYNGQLNIDAHFDEESIDRVLHADLLDSCNSPIEQLIIEKLGKNRALLLSKGKIGKIPRPSVSKAGRERLAALEAEAGIGAVLKVDFENCDLKFVPQAIANFTQAKALILKGNKIDNLPDWLGTLDQLEVLDISDCALTSLPDCLARLPRLRELYVAGNALTAFPASEGGFAALDTLHIGHAFSDSAAHDDWAFDLPLAQFPTLRSFTSHLNVSCAMRVQADFDAWHSTTLEHLKITSELEGEMPLCLERMTQLRSIDLQIFPPIEASALKVLSQLGNLEALQLSYGKPSCTFLSALAKALPGTLIRHNNVSKASGPLMKALLKMTTQIGKGKLDEALLSVEKAIEIADGLAPCISASEQEGALLQKLMIRNSMAFNAADVPARSPHIQAAAEWAAAVLARYTGLSVPTFWRLGHDLGTLRMECQIALAWWMLRRPRPARKAALALLDQAQHELHRHLRFTHLVGPLQNAINDVRAIGA